jgi:polyphosphate kinase 2 (PPK2 family)
MKKIDPNDFRLRAGKKVDLGKWPTSVKPVYRSQEEYQTLLAEHVHTLRAQQSLLYASDSYALLLIFQAMDAAGKDSAIKHVMSGVNPQGCEVFSFRHPSSEELDHDFLWKAVRRLPERGRIGIFNRSYYEEVLIVRVHSEILPGERLPAKLVDQKTIWRDRYRSIVNLEDHLTCNGTRIPPRRTGNSASTTLRRGNTGTSTRRRMRPASAPPALARRHGTSCLPMTRKTPN